VSNICYGSVIGLRSWSGPDQCLWCK